MSLRSRLNRTHLAAILGALVAAATGLLLHKLPFGAGLVNSSYDLLLMARGDVAVPEAVIVYLDELSERELKQSFNAWDRSLHARLIERLTAAGARAIIFDVLFKDPNPSNDAGDQSLVKATKESRRVILAADNVPTGPNSKQIVPPFPLLLDSAADVGSVEFWADPDLVVRRLTPKGDSALSSLSWAAARFLKAKVAQNDSLEDTPRWMNYYGRPNLLPKTSYYQALEPSQVPDDFFRDKAVFVGARIMTKFAQDRKDEYPNPFSFWLSKGMFSPGVEIQATAFLNLLRGDWLTRTSWLTERWLILAVGLLFGYGLVRFHPVLAATLALTGMLLVFALSYLIFRKNLIWFPWLIVVVQIFIAAVWSVLFNSIQLYVQKRLYEQTLRLYLPPSLVKKFAKSRALLKPGAEKQTLTLFFSDIADFSSVSEGMDSDDLAGMMNAYFQTAVSKCIHKAEGTVAKYVGDGIFAFWNAPDAQADHQIRACEAALLFRQEAGVPIHGRVLRTRIGLHTGVANVGNFGSEDRVDYTALGESVNLASRLEGLNKHLGTDCLISAATKAGVGDRLTTRPLGSFQLKGFEGLVAVHELIGGPEKAEPTRAWRDAFVEALNNYEQRNLEFAEIGFRRVLELRPEDGPSNFYLRRIAELAKQPLPDDWATHTVLREK